MELEIYKSSKKDQTYLYVHKSIDHDEIPEALMSILGELKFVMNLTVTTETRLASADVNEVIAQVSEKGFYLQMPPKLY